VGYTGGWSNTWSAVCLGQCRLHGTDIGLQHSSISHEHAGTLFLDISVKVLDGPTVVLLVGVVRSLNASISGLVPVPGTLVSNHFTLCACSNMSILFCCLWMTTDFSCT
jgi:hypothetical protein